MSSAIASPARAPRVAVIVPAYGVAHLLGDALDSLLAQTMPDWECVVIDDGAPDDVAGAVAPYLRDPRIRFLATANHRLPGARNRAIAASSAPYLALLDGDDLFRPEYLERMTAALDADPDARLATCNARIFGAVPQARLCFDRRNGTGNPETGSLSDVLDRSFGVYIGSVFRRADWERVGGFDESFTHCEDLDFWVRLMMLGGHARYVDAVLGEYRVRPGSLSGDATRMIRGNLRVYEKVLANRAEGPEAGVAHRMIGENHARLAVEEALQQVAQGDVARGLPELRKAWREPGKPGWRVAFLLWRALPALAPPMLRWRQARNARGGDGADVPPIGPGAVTRPAQAKAAA
jgi:glycosyltransferase involved in cell wall biosynthesis